MREELIHHWWSHFNTLNLDKWSAISRNIRLLEFLLVVSAPMKFSLPTTICFSLFFSERLAIFLHSWHEKMPQQAPRKNSPILLHQRWNQRRDNNWIESRLLAKNAQNGINNSSCMSMERSDLLDGSRQWWKSRRINNQRAFGSARTGFRYQPLHNELGTLSLMRHLKKAHTSCLPRKTSLSENVPKRKQAFFRLN